MSVVQWALVTYTRGLYVCRGFDLNRFGERERGGFDLTPAGRGSGHSAADAAEPEQIMVYY